MKELLQLEKTFATAVEMDINTLCSAILSASALPLYIIGSGGSLSVAHLVSFIHQQCTNKFAKAITPLESVNLSIPKLSWFWLLSAGGKNIDINDALKYIIINEPKHLLVTCASTGSPLAKYARTYEFADVFDFNLTSGQDGFLATNTSIAFSILIIRAYQRIFQSDQSTPDSIEGLLKYAEPMATFLSNLRELCAPLWRQEYLVVLFGPATQPAAFDLESKFSEAALGSVLLADYRNFAHGRHHWLAKRGEKSAVIAFTIGNEKKLAEKTLSVLPQEIPAVLLNFSDQSIYAPIAALITVLYIVALAGEARGIDPGRPGVPPFGRQIYRMRLLADSRKVQNLPMGVRRKIQYFINPSEQQISVFFRHYNHFIRELQQNKFASIVFDYDGTLCTSMQRFTGIDASVAKELIRLLEAGIPIGIATGRGKSVRKALQQAIPKTLWQRIIVGYYNGAECGDLGNKAIPDGTNVAGPNLELLAEALLRNQDIKNTSIIEIRKHQIAVVPFSLVYWDIVWKIINSLIHQFSCRGTRVVASDHSFDILAPSVSKTKVVDVVRKSFGIEPNAYILSVGDKGAWPGNDFELLHAPFSLSVNEVPINSTFCWNIAPAGYRGVQAMLYYFKCMSIKDNNIIFKLCYTRRESK